MEDHVDIRTVLFCKIKPGEKEGYKAFLEKISKSLYLTIGNYDAMAVYPLAEYSTLLSGGKQPETDNVFSMIFNEKRLLADLYNEKEKYTAFFHPLHVASRYSKKQSKEDTLNFWGKESLSLVVTFVYGKPELKISELESKIRKKIETCRNEDVDYLLYYSFNMSRIVIFWKSNSLVHILDTIECAKDVLPLTESAFLGEGEFAHAHTICGFRYDIVDGINIKDCPADEIIPMVKITGTIRKHCQANEELTKAQKILESCSKSTRNNSSFFTAFGNNDFNFFGTNVRTQNLIELLNNWTKEPGVYDAFFNVKTRVHVRVNSSLDTYDRKYKKYFDFVGPNCNYFTDVLKHYQKEAWCYPLLETVNLLKDMCDTPSLAQIIYFTFENLSVLIQSLDYLWNKLCCEESDNYVYVLDESRLTLGQYVTSLNNLIHQLTRLDGYLSQDPGYSLLVYDMIPAGVLSYYDAYVRAVIQYLDTFPKDKLVNKEASYSMLLVPSLVEKVKTDAVLFFKGLGEEPIFPQNQVYLVEVPYDMLYKPKEMLFYITHEIMHFCGEFCRCREKRYEYFLYFMADYFLADLDMVIENTGDTKDDAPIANWAMRHYVYLWLQQRIDYKSHGVYIADLKDKMTQVIIALYRDTYIKNELLALYTKSTGAKERYFDIICKINRISYREKLVEGSLLNDIAFLFRESYADLMAIRCMKAPILEYLRLIWEEIKKFPEDRYIQDREALFEQRIALVLFAFDPVKCCDYLEPRDLLNYLGLKYECDCNDRKRLKTILSNIKNLVVALQNSFGPCELTCITWEYWPVQYFELSCLCDVAAYLKECVSRCQMDDANIPNYYNIIQADNELFGQNYYALIESQRDKMINKFKNNKQSASP